MNELNPISVYIDTCSFQRLGFTKDVPVLLAASQKKLIKLYVSEVLIWEKGKHHYDGDMKNERIIPHRSSFWRYLKWYRELFERHNVHIIETQQEHLHEVSAILANAKFYFKEKDRPRLSH